MAELWQWLNENAGAIGVIVVVIPLTWSIWQYFSLKRKEQWAIRFNAYHSLIKQLVEPEEKDKAPMLDRQLAVVYELRLFPEYFEPSLSILKGLRESWAGRHLQNGNRLLVEMDNTIFHIKRKSSSCRHSIAQKFRGF